MAAGLRLVLVTGIGGFSPFFFLILVRRLRGRAELRLPDRRPGPRRLGDRDRRGRAVAARTSSSPRAGSGSGPGLVGRGRLGFPSRRDIAVLAAYGVVAGFAFGAVMDLWDWTFFRGAPDLGWQPGLDWPETVARFVRFYLLTSLGYDAFRAIGNAAMVVALGAPMLGAARPAARPLAARARAAGTPPPVPAAPAAASH